MRSRLKLLVAYSLITTSMLFCSGATWANAITYDTTIFNTDWTTAGVGGMRDTGAGTLTVSGVTGPVTDSLLYWHGPTNTTDPTANANVMVNGTGVTGTNIGFSQDNFWGHDNSQAYKADTTSIINGNGSYALTDFNKPGGTDVNGAGSLVFFNDGNSANNRDVVIFDGNDSNFASAYDPAGWDIVLNGINYSGGQAFVTFMVSDGQNFAPNDDGTIEINGSPLVSGGIFQGASVPGPSLASTGSNGNLWDIESFDITSFLVLGVNNLEITLDAGFDDALSDVVTAIDLPAGAAPSQPGTAVPEPISLSLFGMGIIGAVAMRRLKKS